MATIPAGQKFHTVSSDVDTVDRGSAQSQSDRAIYTMQDIADSAGSFPTFTTKLDTEIQVGTVNEGGVINDLFYKRLELLPVVGNSEISATTSLLSIVKTNILIQGGGNYPGSDTYLSGFDYNDPEAQAAIILDAKGNTVYLLTPGGGNIFNSDYIVTYEFWYTK